MQAAIRITPASEVSEHKEKCTRRPVDQDWSKMEGGSKKVKSKVWANGGDRFLQSRDSTKVTDKSFEGGTLPVAGSRIRGRKRAQVGSRRGESSPARKLENTKITPRFELGVPGGVGYRRGGQKQTWDVKDTPEGHTDLSRKKYSVQWLCHRGYSKSVHSCILDLPEALNKQRLSAKSQKRRYPFDTHTMQMSSRRSRNISSWFKDGPDSIDMEPKFESDNKQQHWKNFCPVKASGEGTVKSTRFDFGKTEVAENAKTFSFVSPFKSTVNDSVKPLRGSGVPEGDLGCSSPTTLKRAMLQHPEKDKLGIMPNNTFFVDDRDTFTVFKPSDARKAAGPISRPQPERKRELEQRQRISNSTLQGAELAQLAQMLKEKLGKYSVAPQDLAYVSKTAAKIMRTSLKTLGYHWVPVPNPNDTGLTKSEKTKLSYQHEIRKLYNISRVRATKQAAKFQRPAR